MPLNRSLSVLLPVRNVEPSLASCVEEMLEVLPELTDRFELVIIDDASNDGTREVAQELARHYPQIRLCADPIRHGPSQKIRLDVVPAYGEFVIVHDGRSCVDPHEIASLWEALKGACPRRSRSVQPRVRRLRLELRRIQGGGEFERA